MPEAYTKKLQVFHSFLTTTDLIAKYFRIGHMGVSVTDPGRKDLQKALEALQSSLSEAGYDKH